MATFDELLNNPAFAKLFAQARATYNLTTDSSGRHGVNFMGEFFTNPTDLYLRRSALSFKSEHVITGNPLESLPPSSGYWNYSREEEAVRRIRALPGYSDFTLHRVSLGSDYDLGALKSLRVRGGTEYGIMTADETSTTIMRGFSHGKEVTGADLRSLLSTAGMVSENVSRMPEGTAKEIAKKTKAWDKLQKRMKAFSNIDQYSANMDRHLKAFVWDKSADERIYRSLNRAGAEDIDRLIAREQKLAAQKLGRSLTLDELNKIKEDAWEKVSSGTSFVTPQLLEEVHAQMGLRVQSFRDEYAATSGSMTQSERLIAQRRISAMERDLNDLEKTIRKGGSLEGFRAGNFSKDFLMQMGLDKDKAAAVAASIAKGDAIAISKGDMPTVLKNIARHAGLNEEQQKLLAGADIITSGTSIASEASISGVSFKPTHLREGVRTDPQLLSTYSRELFGAGTDMPFESIVNRDVANYKAAIGRILETGELPPGYVNHLEQILELDPTDPDRMKAILGTMEPSELIGQQARARRILMNQEIGLSPATDRGMFQDVSSSLVDFMDRAAEGAKHTDMYGFAEASIQGHVRTDMWARLMGLREGELGAHTFGVSDKLGIIYNAADFVGFGSEAHGGADLDDLLGSMLYWDEESKGFLGILKRSPMGLGELAGLRLDERSVENYARIMTGDNLAIPQNPALREALDQIGFYEKGYKSNKTTRRKVAEILKENVPVMDLETKESLKKLGFMFTGKGITSPSVPSSMRVLTPADYEDALRQARARLDYVDLPTGQTLGQLFPEGGLSKVSEAEWRRAINISGTRGMLGKYSLVREMADELARTADVLGIDKTREKLKPFAMEPIIDIITQGVANKYPGMAMTDVEVARQSLLRGIAEVAVEAKNQGKGILDPTRFAEGVGRNASNLTDLQTHLTAMGSEYTVSDLFMDEHDRNAVYSQAKAAKARERAMLETFNKETMSKIPEDPILGRVFFSDQAVKDAALMRRAYDEASKQAAELSGLPGEALQREMLGDAWIDTSSNEFAVGMGRDEMHRAFASFFEEDGTMGKRATEAIGAFMQKHGTSAAGRAARASALSDAAEVAKSRYVMGSRAIQMDSQNVVAHSMRAAQVISREHILGSLSPDFVVPGIKSAEARAGAYNTAKMVKDGLLARGPQGMKMGEAVQKLWGVPSFRNAAIGTAAVVGASLLYRATKDRTVDDLAGPPLLPGGSFYEESQSQPLPPPIGNQNETDRGQGVTYQVQAHGNFAPTALKAVAEGLTGISATGAVFKSLGLAAQKHKRDPRKSF